MNDKKTNGELTLKKLRTYMGFENTTIEESEKQIIAIKAMARILFRLYVEDQRKLKG